MTWKVRPTKVLLDPNPRSYLSDMHIKAGNKIGVITNGGGGGAGERMDAVEPSLRTAVVAIEYPGGLFWLGEEEALKMVDALLNSLAWRRDHEAEK